jgi:hypothetical protein
MSRPGRRELLLVLAVAWVLVILRSLVYLLFEHAFFESDQAIVGLMAKHLVEGRAFPLFYYGQTYLLGVDAWVAAPFFLVFGPTVPALRASLVFTNLAIVTVLLVSLVRYCGLRPRVALVAAVFFAFTPPLTASSLVEAGANIGPFFWVLLLWIVIDRPLWFGAILALGFLNREFTIYALPPILIGQLLDRSLFTRARLRSWLVAGVAFFAVWQTIDALKPYADLMGPGTRGQLVSAAPGSQLENILFRLSVEPASLWHRAVVMATDFLPRELGTRAVESWVASQGRDWLLWPMWIALVAAAVRAWHRQRRDPEAAGRARYGWYLAGIGLTSALVYMLTRADEVVIDRYLLLALYLPIGVLGAFLAVEPRRSLRAAMIAVVGVWAAVSAADHGKLMLAWRHPPPNELRELVDGLLARDIHIAQARYWRAYNVTFLSQERVVVASTDVVRIQEYERLAVAAGADLVTLSEEPCAGEKFLYWYLCKGAR